MKRKTMIINRKREKQLIMEASHFVSENIKDFFKAVYENPSAMRERIILEEFDDATKQKLIALTFIIEKNKRSIEKRSLSS